MASSSLVLVAAVSIFTGLTFMVVGATIRSRATSQASRRASIALALWWMLLGGYLLVQGVVTLAAGFDRLGLTVYLTTRVFAIPALCGSVAAILYHVTYVYTGDSRKSLGVASLYVPVALIFAYATFALPQRLIVSAWLVQLDDSSALYRLTYALVGLPPIIASLAYLGLLRRTADPLIRYRIWLVATTIAAYIAGGLAARLGTNDIVKVITLVGFGLIASVLVFIAYHPPALVRMHLGADA